MNFFVSFKANTPNGLKRKVPSNSNANFAVTKQSTLCKITGNTLSTNGSLQDAVSLQADSLSSNIHSASIKTRRESNHKMKKPKYDLRDRVTIRQLPQMKITTIRKPQDSHLPQFALTAAVEVTTIN